MHFYRAVLPPVPGATATFDPRAALERIDGLPFADAGRYLNYQDSVLCAWVDDPTPRARLRFATIRREGLPFVEERGAVTALEIPEAAGLVEQCHVVCFEHNIVGCEFNFYGPRLSRLGPYLRERGGDSLPRVRFEPLVRRDVAALLDSAYGVRIFRLRIRNSDIAAISDADRDLGSAFAAEASLSEAEELEIQLRPRAYARGHLGNRMLQLTRRLARRQDIGEVASMFSVDVQWMENGASETVNLLDDRLVATRPVARSAGRGRAVDTQSAYAAIESAYGDLEEDLLEAASIEPLQGDDG
jgi:hypothetical protein